MTLEPASVNYSCAILLSEVKPVETLHTGGASRPDMSELDHYAHRVSIVIHFVRN